MRIFTAITFDDYTMQYLKKLTELVPMHYRDARMTGYTNLHMTVAFIGEADRITVNKVIKASKKTAEATSGFTVETIGMSAFKRKNKYTVICDIKDSEDLSGVYGRMITALSGEGLNIDKKKYRPHITLARQAVLTGKTTQIKTPEHVIEVKEFCVMESSRINGVLTYTPIAKFKFGER